MNEIQFLMYEADEKIEVVVKDETIWATQKAIANLFGVDRTSISRHLKNIFDTGELDAKVVCAEIAQTTQHGAIKGKTQTKEVKFYNLDAIISVGYRVNSKKATKFRIWATDVLKDYIQKGFKIDAERMKQGGIPLSMQDFAVSIDEFLKFNRYDILKGHGRISHNDAKQKAIEEYREFNKHQKIDSDFDKEIRKIQGGIE